VSGNLYVSGDITAFSDGTAKHSVQTIPNAIELIKQLRGVYYTMNNSDVRKTGVIAQEVERVFPEVVATTETGKSVAYGNIVGLLIEGIKTLSDRCDDLEKKLAHC
jgi:hypothetical protein